MLIAYLAKKLTFARAGPASRHVPEIQPLEPCIRRWHYWRLLGITPVGARWSPGLRRTDVGIPLGPTEVPAGPGAEKIKDVLWVCPHDADYTYFTPCNQDAAIRAEANPPHRPAVLNSGDFAALLPPLCPENKGDIIFAPGD
jgi:hypothetical protein